MPTPSKGVSALSPDLTALLKDLLNAKPKTPGATRGSAPGRDVGLGAAISQLNERYNTEALGKAGVNVAAPTDQQRASYYRQQSRAARPDTGGRVYQTTSRQQAAGPRKDQDFRTFVKRDDSGDIFRYHQYVTPSGRRKVFRVGGAINRSLS